MARRAKSFSPEQIAAALSEAAARGLAVAMPTGASASSFKPGDAEAARAWGLIEATPAGRRFNPTELGCAVHAALAKRKAVA